MQQTGFEMIALNAEPSATRPSMRHKSRTRYFVSERRRTQEGGTETIGNTRAGGKKNTRRNRKSSNVARSAMPNAERLIRSLLNRTSGGATNGIKRTRTAFQKKAARAARLGAWPTVTGANAAPREAF